MMILVGQYDSPFVRRVAMSMLLLGLPFKRNRISVFGDAEAMRRINPLGRIPSLILDDHEVLIDSGAILDYLDEIVGPERALLPARGADRRRALRLAALGSGVIEKAGAIVYERTLRAPEKRLQIWIDRCRTQLDSGLAAIEAVLASSRGGHRFYLGDRPMQPDITIACMLEYLGRSLPEALNATRHPNLDRHLDSFKGIEAFEQTRPSAEEIMPGRPIG